MTWVVVTLLAVVSQTLRNTFSKKLSGNVGGQTVSLCRFLFALPVVAAGYFIGREYLGDVKIVSAELFLWVFLYSVSQILANILLISLFRKKNFAIAVTYTKTETIFAAILSIVLLSENLTLMGWGGVIVAFSGLLLSSFAKEKISFAVIKNSFHHKSTHIGLLSGFLFGFAAIAIKRSFVFLETDSMIMKSIFVLLIGVIIQVTILTPVVYMKAKSDLLEVIKHPKVPFFIGVFSGLGSFFWFFAFAIAFVAYVKTVGQMEFILSVFISVYWLRERIYPNEILGMGLIILGTILLLFA